MKSRITAAHPINLCDPSRFAPSCANTSLFFAEPCLMNHSTLVTAQLNEPLRAYALTVEEAAPGEFKWRILENHGSRSVFESVCCSETTFAAYDTALATGYGELQRLIGPDLQFGPRREPQATRRHVTLVASDRQPATVGSQLDKAEHARV
jgi:hypothetical protein